MKKIVLCLNFIQYVCNDNNEFVLCNDKKEQTLDKEKRNLVEQTVAIAGKDNKVIVIAAGLPDHKIMMREALALGCDESYLIVIGQKEATSDIMSGMVSLISSMDPSLIITGYRIMDGLYAPLGALLAAKLGIPQLSCCKEVEIVGKYVSVMISSKHQEKYAGISPLPCVVTLLNKPIPGRILSVSEINEAFQKNLTVWKNFDVQKQRSDCTFCNKINIDFSEKYQFNGCGSLCRGDTEINKKGEDTCFGLIACQYFL